MAESPKKAWRHEAVTSISSPPEGDSEHDFREWYDQVFHEVYSPLIWDLISDAFRIDASQIPFYSRLYTDRPTGFLYSLRLSGGLDHRERIEGSPFHQSKAGERFGLFIHIRRRGEALLNASGQRWPIAEARVNEFASARLAAWNRRKKELGEYNFKRGQFVVIHDLDEFNPGAMIDRTDVFVSAAQSILSKLGGLTGHSVHAVPTTASFPTIDLPSLLKKLTRICRRVSGEVFICMALLPENWQSHAVTPAFSDSRRQTPPAVDDPLNIARSLATRLIPVVGAQDIVWLERAIHGAAAVPPSDREEFVRVANALLKVTGAELEVSLGDRRVNALGLVVKNGSIQLNVAGDTYGLNNSCRLLART